jgi:hypothetical protein
VGENHATGTPAAQDATADEQAHESLLFVPAVFAHFLVALFVLVLGPTPLAKQVSKKHATGTPAAQYATGDQHAQETMVIVSLVLTNVVVTLTVFLLRLAFLTQQMRE